MNLFTDLLRRVVSVYLLASLGVTLACSAPSGTSPPHGDAAVQSGIDAEGTSAAAQVATDESGAALAGAVRTHTLTADEIRLVAIWWSYMAMARQRKEIDPTFFQANINGRVTNLALRWPGLFPTSRTGQTRQAVVGSPADFACGNSCAPSARSLRSTVNAVFDHALDGLLGGSAFNSAYRLFRSVKDSVDAGRGLGMSAEDALAMVLRNPDGEIDAKTVLLTVGYGVSAVGAVAGAAVAIGVGGPTLSAIAGVGAAVNAVLTGREIGNDLGGAAELAFQCRDWRAENCMNMPEPDPDDGMPVPPPITDNPFDPTPPAQPMDPIPAPSADCAPLVDPRSACVPRPDQCPNGSIVCSCPGTHGVWCHPPVCERGGPHVDCGGMSCR